MHGAAFAARDWKAPSFLILLCHAMGCTPRCEDYASPVVSPVGLMFHVL
jgi:hypothetical protein